MKKKLILLFTIFFGICNQPFSQIQKGIKMAGGTASFTNLTIKQSYLGTSESTSGSVLSISPTLGVMVSDNFMVGGSLGFESITEEGESLNEFSIGPFGRYYHSINEKFYVFGQVGFGFGSSKSTGSSTSRTSFNIGPGANYFIKENIAIEGTFTLNSSKVSGISDSFNYNVLAFGLQFYF